MRTLGTRARMLLPCLFVLSACGSAQSGTSAQTMYDQFDRDWQYWMAQYPETATALGYPGGETRWTSYTSEARAARETYLRESLERFNFIDRNGLPEADQLNYDLYRQMLASAVAGVELGNDAMPIRFVTARYLSMPMNQMEGIQQDIPRTIAMMPRRTEGDLTNILERLEAVPTLVDETIGLMREGMLDGRTPPRIALRDLPGQVEAQIVAAPLESPLLQAFTSRPAGVDAATWEPLASRAATTYSQRVAPAFRRLHAFLVEEYLPASRETVGINALPNGDRLYAYNAEWHTTTMLSPQEIHDLGVNEVARIRREMDEVLAKVGYAGRFDAFVQFLRTDPRFYYTNADDLVRGYRDIAKRADAGLARLFGQLPSTPYGVERVPDAIAPSQTTAYYDPGSLVAGRPGYMMANTYKLDARPKYEMEALTLHEAVPGHHLQISLAQELTGLPEFRKHSSFTAYVEGWALYAERLGTEMGFYTDPYSRFGQLTYEMWRAVRLVVDTGIHSLGWTRQQAIDYFLANTAKTAQDITVEVDRYIVWPGQALGYKMGEIRIRELRAEAERELGAAFDIRAFHDQLLGTGAVPLETVATRVRDWIGREKR
ncbi:MAG: hypothetical protein AMXMBFR57_28340 [Acidimicrobiia bacterium]